MGKTRGILIWFTFILAFLIVPCLTRRPSENRYREYLGLPTALNDLIPGKSKKTRPMIGTLERFDGMQSLAYEVSYSMGHQERCIRCSSSPLAQQLKWRFVRCSTKNVIFAENIQCATKCDNTRTDRELYQRTSPPS